MTNLPACGEKPIRGLAPIAAIGAAGGGFLRAIALSCLLVSPPALSGSVFADERSEPDETRLREVVTTLASPEFGGRRGPGGEKAAAYLVDRFRGLKLEPLFEGEYLQAVPGTDKGSILGHNVGACLRGKDPILKDQWVIVSAHFDHLGLRNGRLYPGADDNASGVAMMLEVARTIVQSQEEPRRSVMFVGFDLEESGLFGSRYFVAHSPVPLDRVALFITADMIARALAGVCDSHVFVMGSENAPGLRPMIAEAGRGRGLTVDLMGADLLVLNRSDYGPFRSRGIPFLFFTTGENPRYHTSNDTPETLDYPKLTAISRMIGQITRKALAAPELPRWQSSPDNPFAEAVAIREVLGILLKNSERLKIGRPQLFLINNTLNLLDGIVARGTITPDERSRVIQGCRIVLFTVL